MAGESRLRSSHTPIAITLPDLIESPALDETHARDKRSLSPDMHRKSPVFAAALGAAVLVLSAGLRPAVAARKPNFLFILVDDLGGTDLGCYGSTYYETPNLDRLAAEGVRFTDAYASCPVCSPTRASIMTGKYPARVGITDWIPGGDPKNRKLRCPRDLHQLPLEEVTIAEALREAGYKTFFAGKWHLGGEGHFPEKQGFEINKGGHHKGSPPGGYYSPYKNPKLDSGPDGEYLPDRLTDETMAFMEANRDHPFLAYLAFYTVHTPIQACKRHFPKFEKKLKQAGKPTGAAFRKERNGWTKLRQDDPAFASMVYAMDENVGRLLRRLDTLDLTEDTVVIFTSDNGGLSTLGRQWAPTCNEPFRAGKGWCYEGGIRVPLIIRAPGTARSERACGVPVTSTDFYPTMLELAGLPPAPGQHADGISLSPLLTDGGVLDRDALYWHYPHYHGSTWAPGAAIRAGKWKLIEFYEENAVELYDLASDAGEKQDLSRSHADRTNELRAMLRAWQEKVGAKMPAQNADSKPGTVKKKGRK
jgi:arylsulfatase A-like enzyme